jgi:hypothetical protein
MKTKELKVLWNFGYSNAPELCVLTDTLPDSKKFVWHKVGDFYMAEWTTKLDGETATFYMQAAEGPKGSPGALTHHMIFADGNQERRTGLWSSRPSMIARFFSGVIACAVTFTNEPKRYRHFGGEAGLSVDHRTFERLCRRAGYYAVEEIDPQYLSATFHVSAAPGVLARPERFQVVKVVGERRWLVLDQKWDSKEVFNDSERGNAHAVAAKLNGVSQSLDYAAETSPNSMPCIIQQALKSVTNKEA